MPHNISGSPSWGNLGAVFLILNFNEYQSKKFPKQFQHGGDHETEWKVLRDLILIEGKPFLLQNARWKAKSH
jgi:hypothetical protein